jgi:predicted aspartyl protease
MGTFTYPVTLYAASGDDSATLDALVDTGALFSVFAPSLLRRLGVESFSTVRVKLADGREQDCAMGEVSAQIDGSRRPILCLFGSEDAPPLLGAHALEAYLLTVDPVEKKLTPKEAYLM